MWLREMRSCPNLLCKYPPTLTSDLTLGHYRRLASPALAYSSATAPDDGRREQGFGLRLAGVNPQALLLGRFRANTQGWASHYLLYGTFAQRPNQGSADLEANVTQRRRHRVL
jgi:hypothetical protein